MRSDGKRVKGLSPIVSAIPHIMPRRYDAQNFITEYVDMEPMRTYLRKKREGGVHLTYMSVVLAAYFKAYLKHPQINRFIMNKRVYARNHFCVSFVILKKRADGTDDETTIKVFFEPEDDILSIHRKIETEIEKNRNAVHNNSTDKFANMMFAIPLLPDILLAIVRLMDRWGLLPRFIIDLSPFHTSLFITNLASINTSHIFHHCYEFGTTGVFICMGKPLPDFLGGDRRKRLMPLGVVLDERICTGNEYARFWRTYNRYLTHPELLESGADDAAAEEKCEELVGA